MSKTHWKKLTNPNYLGAYDFDIGEKRTLTIAKTVREMVTGPGGKKEECTVAYFQEPSKPMILNKTNCKTIEKLHHSPFIEDWSGKQITLKVEKVKFSGELVDGLRVDKQIVQPQKDIKDVPCEECGETITGYSGLDAAQMAAYTKKKYGKCLCIGCATKQAGGETA